MEHRRSPETDSSVLYEPKGSLSYSQEPATEPVKSSAHTLIL